MFLRLFFEEKKNIASQTEVMEDVISATQQTIGVQLKYPKAVLGNLVVRLIQEEKGEEKAKQMIDSVREEMAWPLTRRTSPKTTSKTEEWPESLREFATRAFKETGNNKDARSEMERELEKIINAAIADGTLWTIDWKSRPLPIISATTTERTKRKFE